MKKLLLLILPTLLFAACVTPAQQSSVPVAETTVVSGSHTEDNEDPVIAAPTEVPKTLPPVPTPTPEPTPTPTPTPVPTPTPIPFSESEKTRKLESLLYGRETITVVSTRSVSPSMKSEPGSGGKYISPFSKVKGVSSHEWIVLDTVETEQKTYYHVLPIGADRDGYLDVNSVKETKLTTPENPYAVLVRPHGIIYSARTTDSETAAHANYEVVRVIGIDEEKKFIAVLTTDGKTGYVQPGQLRYLSEEEFQTYLHQSCEKPESVFSAESLVSDAAEFIGEPYADTASFLFDLLRFEGLHFNEAYYVLFQKPLEDETLYPKHLYVLPIYNTLLFKLFNSAGDLVTCNGEETEWKYIADYEAIEPGDLLFFADDYGKGDPVIPDVEVVVHGPYSGDLTGCGLYLGEGRMMTVRNGVVADVEIDPVTANTFDSARRICPAVEDAEDHFIECMISMVYDRLGTPYNSIRRIGDESYDCSGLLCWIFRSYDFLRTSPKEPVLDITAASWAQVTELISPTTRIRFVDTGISRQKKTLTDLRRGDLVMLMNEGHNRTGHVMIYLGNNTVIHSTRINQRYQGTLVARFRPHLQSLYSYSRRIESVTPIN